MPLPRRNAPHSGRNLLSPADSPFPRSPLPKVQHSVPFLSFVGAEFRNVSMLTFVRRKKRPKRAEDFVFRSPRVDRPKPSPCLAAKYFVERNKLGRLDHSAALAESISVEATLRKSPGPELFSRRNELVQDRDAGDIWYAFIPSRGRTCRH